MDRAERRHRTQCVMTRRIKQISWEISEEKKQNYFGRCRTLSPFDCGRPHCWVCNAYKRRNAGPTFQELKSNLSHKEQSE